MRATEEVQVAVIGAGPGGLAAALTLGEYGVETLVVDKRPAASAHPRATVATTATMELIRRWGLEERVAERAIEVEWRAWTAPSMAAAAEGEGVEVGLPTQSEAALVSPVAPACIPQDELEPILERRARSLDGVRVERGTELLDLVSAGEDVWLLTLESPGGRRRIVRARYLLGADGIRSTVRARLGIASRGQDELAERIGATFRAPIWPLVGGHRYGIYFITGAAADATFIPAGRPDRWIFATEADEQLAVGDPAAHSRFAERIREAAGVPDLPVEIERLMPVTFGVALADRFRQGSAFLIGDAAHRVTPRGGTGLNAAIRDGFDIGWKLGWVLRGWAGEELLDTYEDERRPVAEFNVERSVRPDGSLLGTGAGLAVDLGGRLAHIWVARDGGLVSTLDLLGSGLTLFAGPAWDGEEGAGAAPVRVERLDPVAAHGLGVGSAGALLVRPDGLRLSIDRARMPAFDGVASAGGGVAALSG